MSRVILAVMLFLVPVASSSAYVDPGTGSMVVQALVAVVVAGGAFVGAFWRKVFRRRPREGGDEGDGENE